MEEVEKFIRFFGGMRKVSLYLRWYESWWGWSCARGAGAVSESFCSLPLGYNRKRKLHNNREKKEKTFSFNSSSFIFGKTLMREIFFRKARKNIETQFSKLITLDFLFISCNAQFFLCSLSLSTSIRKVFVSEIGFCKRKTLAEHFSWIWLELCCF